MRNFHFVHLSNKTERLYQEFKKRLFASSHPLTKRIVIVPSAAMKSWLRLQMAEDPDMWISAGIEIGFIEPTIHHLFQILSDNTEKQTNVYEPSELELALALEESLTFIAAAPLSSMDGCLQKEWLPLLQYLGINNSETTLSKRTFKRIRALASHLAQLFRKYGIYGGRMIADFGNDKPSWQIFLWQQMEWIFADWNYPAKKLDAFRIDPTIHPQDIQIHVFGLSFLSSLHHRFLCHISLHLPIYYYMLSPCQKFWGDVLSNKESLRLKKYWDRQGVNKEGLDVLEEFLRDCNPLLANFGRLGREMVAQIESLDSQSAETYAMPESVLQISCYSDLVSDEIILEPSKGSLTLLEAVQADLLLLRSIENEKISFTSYDGSIQVHAAPKRAREVQVIYDILLSIIDKHHKDENPIFPSDIFVMAPNIEEYIPHIRNVFEASESSLEIQLMDLKIPSQDLAIQGFLHLLSLSHGRWEASALLQLFDYEAFQKKHRFNEEDILIIRKWIKDAGVYWGKDGNHRQEIFERDYVKQGFRESKDNLAGTWEYGLGRLLEGLAMMIPQEIEEMSFSSIDHVESSQSDLLGTLIYIIRSLQADLQPLMDGIKLSLEDWSTYFKCLLDAYFLSNGEDRMKSDRLLIEQIESFGKASNKLSGSTFGFETIYHHLQKGLIKETAIYKESNVQAVRFSSLLPMRAVPAKVIVLMGMSEEQFPGTDQANSLNLLFKSEKADYHPSCIDFDRYMFLESILSARNYVILSYVSQAPKMAKSQSPSLLVKELLSYLDNSYFIENEGVLEKPSTSCFYDHPLVPFHHSYFSKGSRLKSYSLKNFHAAQAFYHSEKRERSAFISNFMPLLVHQEEFEAIQLKDLLAFSKNPLKVYSNKILGIYLDRENKKIIKNEEDLFLSDLNASILIKNGVFEAKSTMLKQAEILNLLPQGTFKEVAFQKIKKDIEQYHKNFKSLNIDTESIFSIELKEHYLEPEFSDKVWKLPPLIVEIASSVKIKMMGRLNNICNQGMVLFHEENDKKVFENWPAYLFLMALIEKYVLSIDAQMIFVKGKKGKIKKFNIDENMTTLADYLEYYLKARMSPSPLVPDWIKHIFTGNTKEFKDVFKINDPYQQEFDHYTKWFKRNSSHTELESSIAHWQPKAKKLFMILLNEGKKKKFVQTNQEAVVEGDRE